MSPSSIVPRPTVEDASDSDDHPIAAEEHSSARSNVRVKRSTSTDVGKGRDKPAPSAASDSGYSSRTAATMSSADSAKSSHAKARGSPPKDSAVPAATSAPASAETTATPRRRRTTVVDDARRSNRTESPSKPATRTTSVKQRKDPSSRPRQDSKSGKSDGVCDRADCMKHGGRSSVPGRQDTGRGPEPPFRAPPRSPQVPPSPSRSHYPPDISRVGYHGPPSEPLMRTNSATRPIPKSYYSGSAISEVHNSWGQGSQMGYGTPHSMFTGNYHPVQHPNYGATAPTPHPLMPYSHGVAPPHSPMMAPPSFMDQRSMVRGTKMGDFGNPGSHHPYGGGPPIITQGLRPGDGAQRRLANPRSGPTTTPATQQYEYDTSEDDSFDDGENQAAWDRKNMPPPVGPVGPVGPARRPILPTSRTSNNAVYTHRQRVAEQPESDYENYDEYDDPRAVRYHRPAQISREPSRRRTSVTNSDRRRPYWTNSSRDADVIVESPRQRRYIRDEPAQRRRQSEVIVDRRRSVEIANLRREAQVNDRGKESIDKQMRDAQAHLLATGGDSNRNPIDNLRMPQDAPPTRRSRGQSASTRSRAPSGGDRSHISERSTATRDASGELKIKLNSTTGVNVEFNGGMENKILNLRPGESGQMEMVISDKQREKQYYEDGSRVTTTTARKSSRSGRDPRDPDVSRTSSRSEREREPKRERPRPRPEPTRLERRRTIVEPRLDWI